MCFRPFDGSSEIELAGLQHHTLGRNDVPPIAVRPTHIEHDFLVHDQFIVQAEVVAVGVEQLLIERFDDDFGRARDFGPARESAAG